MKEVTQKVPCTSHASAVNIYPGKNAKLQALFKHLQTKPPANSSVTTQKKLL